ncbi:MAG: hypothetical protein HY286_04395 [Planctomycetes bacterium]|nr:hypothetical protein [Planctomycetota bacterium]
MSKNQRPPSPDPILQYLLGGEFIRELTSAMRMRRIITIGLREEVVHDLRGRALEKYLEKRSHGRVRGPYDARDVALSLANSAVYQFICHDRPRLPRGMLHIEMDLESLPEKRERNPRRNQDMTPGALLLSARVRVGRRGARAAQRNILERSGIVNLNEDAAVALAQIAKWILRYEGDRDSGTLAKEIARATKQQKTVNPRDWVKLLRATTRVSGGQPSSIAKLANTAMSVPDLS